MLYARNRQDYTRLKTVTIRVFLQRHSLSTLPPARPACYTASMKVARIMDFTGACSG